MSLSKTTQSNYENQIKKNDKAKLNEIYFNLLHSSKMFLTNDNFTSFHDRLFDKEHLKGHHLPKNDCSRSFDSFNFKNRNLITLNNSLFINDPLNDSLQWCLEPGYQNSQKCPFDNELNNDLYANSSLESKATIDPQQINSFNDSSKYSLHSNQNYNQLSRNLDANLAQMDIETFSRLDMNNLLNEINNKFNSSSEQLINNCSIDDSLISGINECSNNLRFDECLNGTSLKPALNCSFTLNSTTKSDDAGSTACENNCKTSNDLNDTVNLESVGISVDSLDNSYFERKCEEVVNKCKTQDKSKYKLTFEQMDDSITESLINYFQNDLHKEQTEEERQQTYERYLRRLKNNEIYLNRLFDDLNRRMQMDKLSKSEYSTNGRLQDDVRTDQTSQQNALNELNNLTKSLQNNLTCNDYVPLFNLNNSFNSDSSPLAPKNLNLVKLFNSKSQNSSLESQSSVTNTNRKENGSERIDKCDKNCAKTTQTNEQLMNQNNLDETKVNTVESQYTTFRHLNSTPNDRTGVNKITNNLKIFYNRQASPIREEDERDATTARKESSRKYTNFQDMTNKRRDSNSKLERSLDNNDQDDEWNDKVNCPRSFSMNDFNSSKRPNLLKQYSLKAVGQLIDAQQQQQSKPVASRTNRNHSRECSLSSGYLSSGGSNNLFNNDRKNFQLNQRIQQQSNPQTLTVLEDKQVQTSIYDKNRFHQTSASQTHHQQPILINELPKNCCQNSTHSNNTPIYCFFPNYSLPDLNFVNDSSISFQNLHLSPTKFHLPNLDSSADRRPPANNVNLRFNKAEPSSKIRPKSLGDFEKIAKDAIKHIQDWDSLKTLLPDDIRDLIIGTLNAEELENVEGNNDKCSTKVKSKTTSNTPTSNKTFQMATIGNYLQQSRKSSLDNNCSTTAANAIKLRNLKLNRGFSLDKNQSTNKRFSLQEPLSNVNECMLDCSANTQSEASNCSNQRRGMIKSATMNMPIIIQQQQQLFQQQQLIQQQRQFQMSRMSCHGSCHSCCSINQATSMCPHQQQQMNMGSCYSSCHCSFNHLNQMNNFCNHHCGVNSQLEYYQQLQQQQLQQKLQQQQLQQQQLQQQFKMTSPLKPFNSIIQEQNEENDFESLNCLLENENENGELDFDRLLNCNQETIKLNSKINQKDVKARINSGIHKGKSNRKDNFNELKSHWEQVTNSTSTPNTPTTSTATKISKQTKRPISNTTAPVRYARSQVKAKVNTNRRSRSKSPEKSSKEVIILTKKKPEIAAKPHSNTLTRNGSRAQSSTKASSTSTQPTSKPVRPSSFNSQFKSMIPRPTTRSPLIK